MSSDSESKVVVAGSSAKDIVQGKKVKRSSVWVQTFQEKGDTKAECTHRHYEFKTRYANTTRNDLLDLQELSNLEQNQENDYETAEEKLNDSLAKIESNVRRSKRQIGFSDEYPLPVMQNTNVFDYEEMMEALSGQYPNAEKRFMGECTYLFLYSLELGSLGNFVFEDS